jgi:uncharacterized protein (TIGR03086 family)
MSEVAARYRTIADGFTARLTGVAADQWSRPTPCTDWTVRDLVAHVMGTHRTVLGRLDQAPPVPVDASGDLVAQWSSARGAVEEALADEARAPTVIGGMFGEQPFESLVGRLVCADTLVHTWDLARATEQDEQLDAPAVAKAIEFLTPIDEAIRRPGGFAPKITPADDADEQTRLLNFCGRAV